MKRLSALLLLALSFAASATTLNPVQLLNPAGSSSGQAIVSTGASSAPAWGNVSAASLAAQAANTVVANVTGSSASPTAFAMPSCSTSSSALNWTTSTGFTCNASINAATLGAATFAAPGPIGSTTASTGAFTTLSASSTVSGAGFTTLLSPYAPLASPTFTGTVTTAALTATGLISPSSTNGIKGTTTNDNANAGAFGEYVVNSTAGTSMTTATTTNATSTPLTAGDWDVQCTATFVPAAGTIPSIIATGVSTTSATLPGSNTGGYVQLASSFPASAAQVMISPTVRVSVASTTTTYCVVQSTFTTSTQTVNGFIRARRIR